MITKEWGFLRETKEFKKFSNQYLPIWFSQILPKEQQYLIEWELLENEYKEIN